MGKITTYPALTNPNNNDLLVIEDSVSSSTKKITRSNFLSGTALPANTVDAQAIAADSITAAKMADASVMPENLVASTGTSWPWTLYNPTWTAAVGTPAIGNGTMTLYFKQTGKTVTCRFNFTPGSSTTFGTSGVYSWTLPVTSAANYVTGTQLGTCYIVDTGTRGFQGYFVWATTTTFQLHVLQNGTTFPDIGFVQTNNPQTWAQNDYARGTFTYEAV